MDSKLDGNRKVGVIMIINGYDLTDEGLLTDMQHLRNVRRSVCFQTVNRGRLWYDDLSLAQLVELRNWYRAWLDVTQTLVIPKAPQWLADKLNGE